MLRVIWKLIMPLMLYWLLKLMVQCHLLNANLGYVYQMTAEYITHLLDLIITTAIADSMPLNNLTFDIIQSSLSSNEERKECIKTVLRSFSETAAERNCRVELTNQSVLSKSHQNISMVWPTHLIFLKQLYQSPRLYPKMAIIPSRSSR